MDVVERLSLEQASEPTLLALTHVHRYEIARELCRGLTVLDLCCGSGYGSQIIAEAAASVTGVDNDERSIDRATTLLAEPGRLSFELADAAEVLERPLAKDYDAIVLLEGLEHLPDGEGALARLRAHADSGMLLIVSLPNARVLQGSNEYHVTDFDLAGIRAAFERFPNVVVLYQFFAEGSLIGALDADAFDGDLKMVERARREHCNHFVAIVNPERASSGDQLGDGQWSSRMRGAVAPAPNTYMLELERANKRLWRTNQRLARERMGVADAGAASILSKSTEGEVPAALALIADGGQLLGLGLKHRFFEALPPRLAALLIGLRARLRRGAAS